MIIFEQYIARMQSIVPVPEPRIEVLQRLQEEVHAICAYLSAFDKPRVEAEDRRDIRRVLQRARLQIFTRVSTFANSCSKLVGS